ncbi:MAG: twin-arginine translocase TatA/TatE family subunit [Flavobacterium sp.]|nr:twin-arginine translocase TatA/TatE family subunit [Flavobacterium sp.]
MFGVGFSELIFIVFIVLMLFGSKEIPQIARFMGKTMAQIKNATNEIKSEITKSAQDNGFDMKTLTGGVSEEIAKAKTEINNAINPLNQINPLDDITSSIEKPIQDAKEDIENLTGPIKRQN